jgi:hypothetical protein
MVLFSALSRLLGQPISRHHLAPQFGRRILATRWTIANELLWGFILVLPVCVILSQCTKRFVISRKPYFFSWKAWSALVFTVVGDLLLEVWLLALACLPLSPDDIDDTSQWKFFFRRWGFQCAPPLTQQEEILLGPGSSVLLLGIRLLFMSVGAYIGQSFVPVALTGSIATGTYMTMTPFCLNTVERLFLTLSAAVPARQVICGQNASRAESPNGDGQTWNV